MKFQKRITVEVGEPSIDATEEAIEGKEEYLKKPREPAVKV